VEVQLYSILNLGTRRGGGSASRLGRTLPPGKTRYPLCRRLCGSQGRSGLVRKISPPPGFDPRTVKPVGSRYADCATRPTSSWAIPDAFSLVFTNNRLRVPNSETVQRQQIHFPFFFFSGGDQVFGGGALWLMLRHNNTCFVGLHKIWIPSFMGCYVMWNDKIFYHVSDSRSAS
jgi:hypothetical protein